MAANNDTASMALFCDFENVALGVRDAKYEKFDIRPVLERLLAKGSIVVKKAYCDWDRYKAFKAGMHEANFELIEIPHVRQSGKNSADIRLVVDALDLCYTKSHVDTFVIISGDSDFSPLVSKLRENAKRVIGVGVKQSCSDLLIANCDEFIYYDDLVRDERNHARRESREVAPRRSPEEENSRRDKLEARKTKAVELAAATFADLSADRGETERIWASVLKEAIKRRNPGFNESYFGFRSFGNLLEEAANRGLLGFGRDEKSGAYVTRVQPRVATPEGEMPAIPDEDSPRAAVDVDTVAKTEMPAVELPVANAATRRRGGNRRPRKETDTQQVESLPADAAPLMVAEVQAAAPLPTVDEVVAPVLAAGATPRRRGGRRSRPEGDKNPQIVEIVTPEAVQSEAQAAKVAKPRKPRSRKPKPLGE